MTDADQKTQNGKLLRRMNWQAVAAFLAVVSCFVGLVKWAAQIDGRIGAVQESFVATKESIKTEINAIRSDNATHFADVNAAITEGNHQREKATDRLEVRVQALNETINRFLLQSIPLRKAAYAGADGSGSADTPERH